MTCGPLEGSEKYENYLPDGSKVMQSSIKAGLVRLL